MKIVFTLPWVKDAIRSRVVEQRERRADGTITESPGRPFYIANITMYDGTTEIRAIIHAEKIELLATDEGCDSHLAALLKNAPTNEMP